MGVVAFSPKLLNEEWNDFVIEYEYEYRVAEYEYDEMKQKSYSGRSPVLVLESSDT